MQGTLFDIEPEPSPKDLERERLSKRFDELIDLSLARSLTEAEGYELAGLRKQKITSSQRVFLP